MLLSGYRGAPPANRASLLDLLHRVSLLASEHPDLLELDLNPVLARPGTNPCLALDARVRLGAAGVAPASTTAEAPTRR